MSNICSKYNSSANEDTSMQKNMTIGISTVKMDQSGINLHNSKGGMIISDLRNTSGISPPTSPFQGVSYFGALRQSKSPLMNVNSRLKTLTNDKVGELKQRLLSP